jgi:arylsulfate sulfotransferase
MTPRSACLLAVPALLTLVGCDRSPPVLDRVEIAPNENTSAPLAAVAVVWADEPVTVTFRLEAGGVEWNVDPETGLALEHRLPLLGLRPGAAHRISVVATDEAGNETTSDPIELSTEPLPEEFPRLTVETSLPERMEPGATLFNLMLSPPDGESRDYGALVIVDARGEVIWYYQADHGVIDARRISNGNLLYLSGRTGPAYEIDMLGNVVSKWTARRTPSERTEGGIAVDTETFHHEVLEMPSGNLLALSTEVRDYGEYPSSTIDPRAPTQHASVVGDVVVEFGRDGSVQRELDLLDVLDPLRTSTGPELEGGYWEATYGEEVEGALIDWGHTNAVFFDRASNAFLLSVRRQDAVVKVDVDTGDIVWILGPHDRWSAPWTDYLLTPVGAVEWPNHQHAPMTTPHGTVLLFDNGTYRDGPTAEGVPASEKYSRAVEYAIDEEAMEVRQVWQYGGRPGEEFYASFISDADWLHATENVLITAGGVVTDADGIAVEPTGRRSARIIEVTHETPSEKVFELVVDAEWDNGGWHVYRAERLSSLYGPES